MQRRRTYPYLIVGEERPRNLYATAVLDHERLLLCTYTQRVVHHSRRCVSATDTHEQCVCTRDPTRRTKYSCTRGARLRISGKIPSSGQPFGPGIGVSPCAMRCFSRSAAVTGTARARVRLRSPQQRASRARTTTAVRARACRSVG